MRSLAAAARLASLAALAVAPAFAAESKDPSGFSAGAGSISSSSLPMNVHQYTPAGYTASVAPLLSRAWHAPSGFQTAHLANGMTMNVPIDLPSTAVYAPTGTVGGAMAMGGVTGVGAGMGNQMLPGAGSIAGAGIGPHGMSALDPELAYVQQQQLAEKARIAQEIQALQYEAAMRARDVAMSNMGVHVAEQRLAHAQQLAHAVHARLAAAQRQLAALDVAQRRASDQSQLNQLQAALAEASASEAALSGARAGHQSLVHALQASIKAASSRVNAATGAIETILSGQGSKPTEISGGSNGVKSDIAEALTKQMDIAKERSVAIADFQKTLSNAVPSAADLVTKAHDDITNAGEAARSKAIVSQSKSGDSSPAESAGTEGSGGDDTKLTGSDGEDEDDKEDADEDADEDEDEDKDEEAAFVQTQAASAQRAASVLRQAARTVAGRVLRGRQ